MDHVFVTIGASAIGTALTVSGLAGEALRWIGSLSHIQVAGLPF